MAKPIPAGGKRTHQVKVNFNDFEINKLKEYCEKTGLDKLITSGYDLLNLNTFFTSGPKETRAWTVRKNTEAQKAAGVIHSDFEKNFIRAEVVSYDDFKRYGSFEKAKENGKLKVEGKNYFVKDGDVLIFRVNP